MLCAVDCIVCTASFLVYSSSTAFCMLTRRRSGGSPAACRLSALLKEAAVAGSRVHAVQESVSAHCDPLLLQNLVNAFSFLLFLIYVRGRTARRSTRPYAFARVSACAWWLIGGPSAFPFHLASPFCKDECCANN